MRPKEYRILDALGFSEHKLAQWLNISRRKTRGLLIAFERGDEDVFGIQGGKELAELITDQLDKLIVVRWELLRRRSEPSRARWIKPEWKRNRRGDADV